VNSFRASPRAVNSVITQSTWSELQTAIQGLHAACGMLLPGRKATGYTGAAERAINE
jgi:hypothetical protein